MKSRSKYVQEFSELLGDSFEYFYDTDYLPNQRVEESKNKTINFKLKPNKKTGNFFNEKLNQLKDAYKQFYIDGGNMQGYGYLIYIQINTVKELENELHEITQEYNNKVKTIQDKIDILRNSEI